MNQRGDPGSEYFLLLTRQTLRRLFPAALTALIATLCLAGFTTGSGAGATATGSKSGGLSAKKVKKTRVKPRVKPRLKLSHRHVRIGEAVRLRGRVRAAGRRPFKAVVRGPRSAVVKTTTSKRGRYRQSWRPKRPGIYRLRAYVGRNGHARGGVGTRRTITVYRPAHASWYGPGFYGNRTACGQTLTSGMLGVAHKTLPCGTKLKLRHGKRRVTVRVIDRGPFIPGREFDLTYATKQRLGFGDLGTVYASR